ncbi:DNA-binding SARP family transcriptional activator [Actinoplanes octamycinicus]|uniref:DNA-binding SARP family transcriptional activator n=1 Tax=Actinoplanes octamycinicus TaxID=135948 RepID=A0A7W7H653_9ACTN|nr:BTAD domain-containing putative transcriptional regulator [Actinoplanes octamycinicus]MBB4744733.1 DNA-binding SARP family transcriptional activator [Actinoplanes octamycinicus]GIE55315.1 SARP family transcriptional regulator [Actinoplanes octamycinicus]
MSEIRFGVLGPLIAVDAAGRRVGLKGPMHRAVLGRLLVARRRVVPVGDLVADLWVAPPDGAVAAVRTFVAALRRALEPDRPPRAPASLLVTEGLGYALRPTGQAVDAWRFEAAARSTDPAVLDEALGWWRGPAYADFPEAPWAAADRARLTELRLQAVESRAAARLDAAAIADLDAHVTAHPWREEGWRLLALALYRTGRQGDALAVLRRARTLLVEQLGVDPGPALRRLEEDVLRQAPGLDPGAADPLARAAEAYDRVAGGARARLEPAVGLLRALAVTGAGGLRTAREQRAAAVVAAEQLGDPELTARVIGAYDVPAVWPRADDPDRAAGIVAAAARTLAALPAGHPAARARLLATIGLEARGTTDPWPGECARQAEAIARELDDPALLAFALNASWMQRCHRTGLAAERDAIGAELIALAGRHGLVTAEVLGHLVRVQARAALGDLAGADRHAAAAGGLGVRHELPLVEVFTAGYAALREDLDGAGYPAVERAYRALGERLDAAGMPGVGDGLVALALLGARLRRGRELGAFEGFGSYATWVLPLWDHRALRDLPDPPPGLLAEALWWLLGKAAVTSGDRPMMRRARTALGPAAGEVAGAGTGMIAIGTVGEQLANLDQALDAES